MLGSLESGRSRMSPRPYFLRRLAGRPSSVMFIDRTPVTPKNLREAELLVVAWSVMFGGCFASLLLIAFFGDRIINVLCRG